MKKFFALFVLLIPLAFAQRIVVSPQAIVVNPAPAPGFNVDVWLDKDPSGDGTPVYNVGDNVTISVRPSETAYIYLFSVKPNGDIQQILPNQYDEAGRQNRVNAGETRTFPPRGARYTFSIDPPNGLSKLIAVASRKPLDTRELATFTGGNPFATSTGGDAGFARGFAIVVRPIPQQDWVTDTVLYMVGNAAPSQQYGSIQVSSSPAGADIYVDGQYVGTSPTTYGTVTGSHDVRISLGGYEDYQTSVSVRANQTARISASLQPIQRTGSVLFRSTPSRADVYVDGQNVGRTPTGPIDFDEGTYTARFVLSGYQDTTVQFRVTSGDTIRVDGSMSRAEGTLDVQANVGGAAVFVDGRQVGTIPNGSGRLTIDGLEPGNHELTLVAPAYRTFVTDFNIQSGRTTPVSVRQSRF